MGDIIWGTFLIILILGIFGLYRFFTRKNVDQRSLRKFISLLLMVGGLLGLLTMGLNERLRYDHPDTFFLSITFFIMQTIASIWYFKAERVGRYLLIFTLLLQVPIMRSPNLSYSNQTLFSFELYKYPGKWWDIEPGSYVYFIYFDIEEFELENTNRKSGFGLNLIPLLTIAVLLKPQLNRKIKIN